MVPGIADTPEVMRPKTWHQSLMLVLADGVVALLLGVVAHSLADPRVSNDPAESTDPLVWMGAKAIGLPRALWAFAEAPGESTDRYVERLRGDALALSAEYPVHAAVICLALAGGVFRLGSALCIAARAAEVPRKVARVAGKVLQPMVQHRTPMPLSYFVVVAVLCAAHLLLIDQGDNELLQPVPPRAAIAAGEILGAGCHALSDTAHALLHAVWLCYQHPLVAVFAVPLALAGIGSPLLPAVVGRVTSAVTTVVSAVARYFLRTPRIVPVRTLFWRGMMLAALTHPQVLGLFVWMPGVPVAVCRWVWLFTRDRPVVAALWAVLVLWLLREVSERQRIREEQEAKRGAVWADDVSRMSSTKVDRIFMVRSAADVQHVIRLAKQRGVQVSMRGTSHTMGGQTIARNGYVIDTTYLRELSFDKETCQLTAGPGATWADAIRFLNQFGRSPMTMQSYSSFAIGGTIAVNAHGITNDSTMCESVVSVNVVTADGELATLTREDELFGYVIGGYGLFGVMTSVTLKTSINCKVGMEFYRLDMCEFPEQYLKFLDDTEDPDGRNVEVKIARINHATCNECFLFIFRRSIPSLSGVSSEGVECGVPTVSDLEDDMRKVGPMSRVLYKWLPPLPGFMRFRYWMESVTRRPVDWSAKMSDRNVLMYESAAPLAQLYNPLVTQDDTFILQEYFVPKSKFSEWIRGMRDIVLGYQIIVLLNITVRFVHKDTTTRLPYAKGEMFAFVFYYRIPRTEAGEKELAEAHRKLSEHALSCGGTFYLPYRHHYTDEQLAQAYPEVESFFKAKRRYDPENLFGNLWFDRYGTRFCEVDRIVLGPDRSPRGHASLTDLPDDILPPRSPDEMQPHLRRTDSFRRVFRDELLKWKLQQFLTTVFNVLPQEMLMEPLGQATWEHGDDAGVYAAMQHHLQSDPYRMIRGFQRLRGQLANLAMQKAQIGGEAVQLLTNAGLVGRIQDYCSIGDAGRYVTKLRAGLGMTGKVYVCHDTQGSLDAVERGSVRAVGEFVPFDYNMALPKGGDGGIPDESCDLVTVMMGLHHFRPERLPAFLSFVKRILRPGGVLIFREHDARTDLLPILDLAHMIFNFVTGVSAGAEAAEIRAFRPVSEWRALLAQEGFESTFLYNMQADDPTEDVMMAFSKPPFRSDRAILQPPADSGSPREQASQRCKRALELSGIKYMKNSSDWSYFKPCEWSMVECADAFGKWLHTVPFYMFPFFSYIHMHWMLVYEGWRVVAQKRGRWAAMRSDGFLNMVVCGIVVTVMFAMFGGFAMICVGLIKLVYRDYYADRGGAESGSVYEEVQHEHFLLTTASEVDWSAVDRRIRVHREPTPRPDSVAYALEVPKFDPFTEVCRNIALKVPSARLAEISGNTDDIALKVRYDRVDAHRELCALCGADWIWDYHLPSSPGVRWAVLRLRIPLLFGTLRQIAAIDGATMEQLYDFY